MSASPFKFLDSYTRADIGDFFGRDKETDELFRRCFISPILVVYGGSGTGKTSLVQCGLSSRFQDSDWLPVPVRRSGDMIASVREAIHAVTLTPSNATDLGQLAANLYLDHFKPIYFLFDQFEELFIFGGHAESEAFFAAVRGLLEKERNAHVLFVVREEYLAELTRYERIIPGLIENRYRVERLTQRHAMEVVEKLCGAHNIPCAEGFSAALVGRLDPEGQGIELSYLQVFLDRCWRTRQGDEPFSPALLERIGHVDDMLGAFLDEQVADTPEPQRSESLLKTFVSDQGTKRQLTSAEAHEWVQTIGVGMELVEVERLLQVFVAKRLLKDRDERGRYELLHDALARQVFQRITRAEQELIEVRQFVQQAHGQFVKRGVKLSANDITYLRPYRNQLHLKGEMKEFVEGAFGEEERSERRKKRLRWVGISALVALLTVTGIYAYKLNRRLQEEGLVKQSISLAGQSMKTLSGDPWMAFLLAEQAFRTSPTFDSEKALVNIYPFLYPLMARYRGNAFFLLPNSKKLLIVDHVHDSLSMYSAAGEFLWSKRCTGLINSSLPVLVRDTNGIVLSRGDSTLAFDLDGNRLYAGRSAYGDACLSCGTGDFAFTVGVDSITYTQMEGITINPVDTTLWNRSVRVTNNGLQITIPQQELLFELDGYAMGYLLGSRFGGVAPIKAFGGAFIHIPSATHTLLSRTSYQTTRMMEPTEGIVLAHFADSLICAVQVTKYNKDRTNAMQGLNCMPDGVIVSAELHGDSLTCHRYKENGGDTLTLDVHHCLARIQRESPSEQWRVQLLNGRFACVGRTVGTAISSTTSIIGAGVSGLNDPRTFLVDLEKRIVVDTGAFKEPATYLLAPDNAGLVQLRPGEVIFFDQSLMRISSVHTVPREAKLFRTSGDRLLFLDSIASGILGLVDMRSHLSRKLTFPATRLSTKDGLDKPSLQFAIDVDPNGNLFLGRSDRVLVFRPDGLVDSLSSMGSQLSLKARRGKEPVISISPRHLIYTEGSIKKEIGDSTRLLQYDGMRRRFVEALLDEDVPYQAKGDGGTETVMRHSKELLNITGMDAILCGRYLYSRVRAFDHYERFPLYGSDVIKEVREEKKFGEFWTHINAEPLINKVLGTDAYNMGYSIGQVLHSTWVKLGLLLGAGVLGYTWWSRRRRLRSA